MTDLSKWREELAEVLSWASGEMTRFYEDAHPDHNRWSWRGDGHALALFEHFRAQADALLASPVLARVVAEAKAEGWAERDAARPQYLGPRDGHYEDCGGWEDCYCASYPNPYRADRPHDTETEEQR